MVKKVLIFVAGSAVGSAVTAIVLKNKYEKYINDEIDSVKEMYVEKYAKYIKFYTENKTNLDDREVKDEPEDILEEMVQDLGYEQTSDEIEEIEEEGDYELSELPYVIKPEIFGEGYPTETFTYYGDDVLTDGEDKPIEDIEYYVGHDSLESFGIYDDDAVYVRNDRLKIDYEILKVEYNYYDED